MSDTKWELVTNSSGYGSGEQTKRLRVPGGWLYRVESWASPVETSVSIAVAITFVPCVEDSESTRGS